MSSQGVGSGSLFTQDSQSEFPMNDGEDEDSDAMSEDICPIIPNSDLSQLMCSVQEGNEAACNLMLQADDADENVSPNTGTQLVRAMQNPENLAQIIFN